ncbi:uncharacterized protein LOC117587458 [Drosophila guanche]|uniref:Blast:PI-PLC X domain-containing protein 3 n=1 Tax=Drosophila guanche TaxID=7266 RepID=A0A3B0JR70_DROGU|nr:uncharacterized protein LOC117587458 [Drosophila guanche]SPP84657.1 blast:PI-PLC X domain-containing protein 3 [Drosophila guanche]
MMKMKLWLLPLLHCLLLIAPLRASCPIYLTISLSGKALHDSCLEVNWGPDCAGPPEWIGIYGQDPTISNFQPELRINGLNNRTGKLSTPIKLGKLLFPGGWNRLDGNESPATRYPRGKCLPHYVASYNGTELLTVECLKIQPNWMAQIKDGEQMPLKSLFLPGTHASGAFLASYSKTKSLLVKDYLVAQHFDVWSQLVFGIRYLDFSVGYKYMDSDNDADNFWIANENMFIIPLAGVLRDVRHFVERSGELVILDFSSFPIGFYKHPEIYSSLFHLLRQELGEVAYQRNVTLDEHCANRNFRQLLALGIHVVLLFPTQELPYPENESGLLCSPWQRFSTSYMNISQTLDYMRLLFSRKPGGPVQDDGWIFTAVKSMEQTLNTHKLQTAKQRAAVINPKVNQWLKGPWGMNANVVSMDYFSNTNIVDLAIEVNAHKAFLLANKDKFINLEILR